MSANPARPLIAQTGNVAADAPVLTVTFTLSSDQLPVLADIVAERLHATPARRLVDAATVAAALGVSRDWVYDHAAELGGIRAGNGDRPRWRFDLEQARNAWQPAGEPEPAKPRRRQPSNGNGRHLLPVHGEAER